MVSCKSVSDARTLDTCICQCVNVIGKLSCIYLTNTLGPAIPNNLWQTNLWTMCNFCNVLVKMRLVIFSKNCKQIYHGKFSFFSQLPLTYTRNAFGLQAFPNLWDKGKGRIIISECLITSVLNCGKRNVPCFYHGTPVVWNHGEDSPYLSSLSLPWLFLYFHHFLFLNHSAPHLGNTHHSHSHYRELALQTAWEPAYPRTVPWGSHA